MLHAYVQGVYKLLKSWSRETDVWVSCNVANLWVAVTEKMAPDDWCEGLQMKLNISPFLWLQTNQEKLTKIGKRLFLWDEVQRKMKFYFFAV